MAKRPAVRAAAPDAGPELRLRCLEAAVSLAQRAQVGDPRKVVDTALIFEQYVATGSTADTLAFS